FLSYPVAPHLYPHRFPTRRSSDPQHRGMSRPKLAEAAGIKYPTLAGIENNDQGATTRLASIAEALGVSIRWLESGKGPMEASKGDRKSTRLNSSHVKISYAVFCLK